MIKPIKQLLLTVCSITAFSYAAITGAHESPRVVLDPEGNNPGFLAYAEFTCFDDGNGVPDHLLISVKDFSPPQANLLLSAQIIGRFNAATTTDVTSGDSSSSPEVRIHEGVGPYQVLVTKSGPGAREFVLTYHCMTANNVHTGNGYVVRQFQ